MEGDQPEAVHQLMAAALETAVNEIHAIQQEDRSGGKANRPTWPMVILRTPKGWNGPKVVDGCRVEGTYRAHQVNELDRFHLTGDVVDRVPRLQRWGALFKQRLRNKLIEHKQYIGRYGDDMPEIRDWKWPY